MQIFVPNIRPAAPWYIAKYAEYPVEMRYVSGDVGETPQVGLPETKYDTENPSKPRQATGNICAMTVDSPGGAMPSTEFYYQRDDIAKPYQATGHICNMIFDSTGEGTA